MRLDSIDEFPSGMREYLSYYGWHFNKKMCEWAASMMYKENGGMKEKIKPYDKNAVDAILDRTNVRLENNRAYDYVYIANMCKADFLGSSIQDENRLAKYVKDVIDDPDGYDGLPFTRFYADCIGSGTPIMWEDML